MGNGELKAKNNNKPKKGTRRAYTSVIPPSAFSVVALISLNLRPRFYVLDNVRFTLSYCFLLRH